MGEFDDTWLAQLKVLRPMLILPQVTAEELLEVIDNVRRKLDLMTEAEIMKGNSDE